jgi:hypothetical protein
MTRFISESHPLHRLFRGLTESTFLSEFGIGDPQLVGYVADLLARFVPSDAQWSIRDQEGRRLTRISEIVAEAETSGDTERRSECHRHVGDLALFWAGVFPETLQAHHRKAGADVLVDVPSQGKHSYYVASTLDDARGPVLRRLSVEFDLCVIGLAKVRQEWERGEGRWGPGPPRLISG